MKDFDSGTENVWVTRSDEDVTPCPTDESGALSRLHEAGTRLWQTHDLGEGLQAMLSATIDLLGADKGNVQLLDPQRNVLLIAAQKGFDRDFLEFFREVSTEHDSACGRALRAAGCVVVEDVESEPTYAPFREVARNAGYRAVVSVPLIDHGGDPLGMLSAHFGQPHRPTASDMQRLDLYARLAAGFVERCRSDRALLRESEERLRLALDTGGLAAWDWNVATGETVWDPKLYRLLGYTVGRITPSREAWLARVHPDDREGADAVHRKAMRSGERFAQQYRIVRPDGTVRWLSARGRFFPGPDGQPVRMISTVHDVTERRAAGEAQKVMIAELQHRTRNLLAVVQSIAQQTLASATSADDFRERFEDRLGALSRVQGLLSWRNVEPVTLSGLLTMEFDALCPTDARHRVSLDGPEVRLRSHMVQVLSLAIHELTTNALKHGAFGSENGTLSVTWRVEAMASTRTLHLQWIEKGISADAGAAKDARHGYGRALIEQALPYSLSADTRFELSGDALHCTLDVPLA